MKRILFFLVAALYCLTGFGQESNWLVGIDVSTTLTSIRGDEIYDDFQTRVGYSGGMDVEYCFNQSFSLKTGLMYELKGSSVHIAFTDENGQTLQDDIVKTNFNYLIIPVLASFNTKGTKKFYVNAGPYLGYLLNKKKKESGYDTIPKSTTNVTETAKRIDFGLSVGVGLYIPLYPKVIMDISLKENLGLINVSEAKYGNSDYSEKTNSFGFYLGFKYML
jgi:hypothetical protein